MRYVLEGDVPTGEGCHTKPWSREQADDWLGQRVPSPLTNVTDEDILRELPQLKAMRGLAPEEEPVKLMPGDEALVVRWSQEVHDAIRPKGAAAERPPVLEFVLVECPG